MKTILICLISILCFSCALPRNNGLFPKEECPKLALISMDFPKSNGKILRRWVLVDWCKRKAGTVDGIYVKTQIVRAPDIIDPGDVPRIFERLMLKY